PVAADGAGWQVLAREERGGDVTELVVRLEREESLDDLLEQVRRGGARVRHCGPEERDLEDVFRRLVRDGAEETR
ncbi:MAG: hypothetical protein D6738_14470, partial [Acidobacteria bacterium]